jgi:sterol desaturase/sphingolipid hydroxylase (fatty acid hydroxylase superfamily)
MRQSRASYYADFAVYPALIALTMLVIATRSPPKHWGYALGFVVTGVILWTLLEYLLHRFVLHGATRVAGLHDQHHAWPRAWIGTPTWLSVAVLACLAILPVLLGASLVASLGLAGGLMAGFFWYGLAHHAIHHGEPQLLARALVGGARRHFRHHLCHGSGNFGVTTSLWDRLFRTSLAAPSPTLHSPVVSCGSRLGSEGQ